MSRSGLRVTALALSCLVSSPAVHARMCEDGDHPEIKVQDISLKYEASKFEATLSGIGVLGARWAASPRTLQTAAVATQTMNEIFKALVVGYNTCAVSRQKYQEAIERLLPGMRNDAEQLERFRQQLISDQRIDRERFNKVLSRYERSLKRFASLSGKDLDYERIEAIVDDRVRARVEQGTNRVLEGQADVKAAILQRLNELERRMSAAPLPTPQEVDTKIGAIRARLQAATERAEAEYRQGYRLIERYRFRDALPHLERAVAAVPLPEFYLALGRTQGEIGEVENAERSFREGIALARGSKDKESEGRLAASYMTLTINHATASEKSYGKIAEAMEMVKEFDRNAWTRVLETSADQGDLWNTAAVAMAMYFGLGPMGSYDLLLKHRADAVQRYGDRDPRVALYDVFRVMFISIAHGNPQSSVPHTHRLVTDAQHVLELAHSALAVHEAVYDPMHPRVGLSLSVIGIVLMQRGDYHAARTYTARGLAVAERALGPENTVVAGEYRNLGLIEAELGDLDAATTNFRRARSLFERLLGSESIQVQALDREIDGIQKRRAAKPGESGATNGPSRAYQQQRR